MPRKFDRKMLVAFDTVLQAKPLDQVTVSELTAVAGITRPAFYYHYSSIEECILFNIERSMKKITDSHPGSEGVFAVMTEVMASCKEYRIFSENIYRSKNKQLYYDMIRSSFETYVREQITADAQRGQMHISWVDRKQIAKYLTDGFIGMLDMFLGNDMYNDPNTLSRKYLQFLGRDVPDILKEFSEKETGE